MPQPIPLTEIESYLNIVGIEDHWTRTKYMELMCALDEVELAHLARKRGK